jgi:eukaryotic-like serine/threonine-protein kinase
VNGGERLRILFLAANPDSTTPLHAGRELRRIRERLAATARRDAVEIVERWAVRPGDLQQALMETRPHVVHVSGHGNTEYELMFEDDDGGPRPVGKEVLAELFRLRGEGVRLVVLSACHSLPQAEAIAEHVDCAIGMRRAIGSEAATELSAALYHAIASGDSVLHAFESARLHVQVMGVPEHRTPHLVARREGADPTRLVLLHPAPAPPPAGPRAPRLPAAAAIAIVAVAVAGAGAALLLEERQSETTSPSCPPASAVLKDDPHLASETAEALGALAAARKAWREGNAQAAGDSFEQAIRLDPSLSAAHIGLVISSAAARDPDEVADALRGAVEHKAGLSARDAAVLSAVTPCLGSQPPDHAECIRRLEALSEERPDDAEIRYLLGGALGGAGDMEKSLAAVDRALSFDPGFGPALVWKGHTLLDLGDPGAAARAFDACWRAAPANLECLRERGWSRLRSGDCALGAGDLESYAALRSDHPGSIVDLATGRLGAGRPLEEVRATLASRLEKMLPGPRGQAEALDAYRTACFTGDFADALARAEVAGAGAQDRQDRAVWAWNRALVLMEIGQSAEAGRVAVTFLEEDAGRSRDRRSAGVPPDGDPTPSLLAIARDAGRISQSTFTRERDAWARGREVELGRHPRGRLWLAAFAAAATSAEDAREALAVRGEYTKSFVPVADHAGEVQIGRVLLLAGRTDDAVTFLRRATESCTALTSPLWHTRGFDLLGHALEARGDRAGACAAYSVVLDRWGGARPRSITAERARGRVKILGCKR